MRKTLALWLVLLGFLPACGYHVLRSDRLFAVHRVAVLPFYEETPANMATPLADQLQRLLLAGGVAITQDEVRAEAILDGTIVLSTAGSATVAGIQAYQVTARVHAHLRDRTGRELWQTDVVLSEDFLPAPGLDLQPLYTETNRRAAILRLAERAAAVVHDNMVVTSSVGAQV